MAGMTLDKSELGENEIALLNVKILNNSESDEQNVILRIKAGEGFNLIEGEEVTSIVKNMGTIKAGKTAEVNLKIKCIFAKKLDSAIYLYYGINEELKNAAVINVKSEPLPVSVKTNIEKKQYNNNEAMTVSYTLQNNSAENIYNVAVEAIAPKDFEIITSPKTAEVIASGEKLEQEFVIMPPLEAQGDYSIQIVYGFFDSNKPHYFEKTINVTMQKTNYQLIGLLGFVVLIIAGYLFLKKEDKNNVKGTGEKK